MNVNEQSLELAYKGFQTVYNTAFDASLTYKDKIAMVIKSTTSEENYAWLGQFPDLRRWLGDRVVKQLTAHGFRIKNEKYESTVKISREDFEDDRFGVYRPMFSEMGRVAKQHPDRMLFKLLANGFATTCFDGEAFFSMTHPASGKDGDFDKTFSNTQGGVGPAWYLLDTSREIKPMIWQERDNYEFTSLIDPKNAHVFMTDDFLFGVRARVNAGLGLWQLAFGSKAALTAENYSAARAAMMAYTGDKEQLLGIMPTHLVVPPVLEGDARLLLAADTIENTSNIWKGSAELVVTPFLN